MIKQVKLLTDDRGRVRIEYMCNDGPSVFSFDGYDYDCKCNIDVEADLKEIIERENRQDKERRSR